LGEKRVTSASTRGKNRTEKNGVQTPSFLRDRVDDWPESQKGRLPAQPCRKPNIGGREDLVGKRATAGPERVLSLMLTLQKNEREKKKTRSSRIWGGNWQQAQMESSNWRPTGGKLKVTKKKRAAMLPDEKKGKVTDMGGEEPTCLGG